MINKFGFLAHTFEFENLRSTAPSIYKKGFERAEQNLRSIAPREMCRVVKLISKQGIEVEGIIATTWLLSSQYFSLSQNEVYQKIIAAVKICEKAGAKIVGLGGYNSIVPPGSGIRVSRDSRIGVTNGNTYTIITSLEAVRLALAKSKVTMNSVRVAILGATGSIGSVLAELFAIDKPVELILVSRNAERLQGRARSIQKNTDFQCVVETDIVKAVKRAHVVVCATSTPDAIIGSEHLLPGTIICDTSIPHNVSEKVAQNRDDVIVFEGGLACVPQNKYFMRPDYTDSFDLLSGQMYGCFCETAMLAMDDKFDHFSLNGISIEKTKQIWDIANKHGFSIAPLKNKKYHPIPDEYFERVGELLRKRI